MAVVTLALTYLAYRLDKRKERRENLQIRKEEDTKREEMIKSQAIMHAENQRRLDTLMEFQEYQLEVNKKRDEQVNLLSRQTSLLEESAKGFMRTMEEITRGVNRRLEMLEERRLRDRS